MKPTEYVLSFTSVVLTQKYITVNSKELIGVLRLKRDGTRAETRFRLSPKRTNPFKSAGASVRSTTSSRGVRISVSNAGYTTFRGSVKGTGYTLHSPVSPSLPPTRVTVRHQVSNALYHRIPCVIRGVSHKPMSL
jgi:hypothetical protein